MCGYEVLRLSKINFRAPPFLCLPRLTSLMTESNKRGLALAGLVDGRKVREGGSHEEQIHHHQVTEHIL